MARSPRSAVGPQAGSAPAGPFPPPSTAARPGLHPLPCRAGRKAPPRRLATAPHRPPARHRAARARKRRCPNEPALQSPQFAPGPVRFWPPGARRARRRRRRDRPRRGSTAPAAPASSDETQPPAPRRPCGQATRGRRAVRGQTGPCRPTATVPPGAAPRQPRGQGSRRGSLRGFVVAGHSPGKPLRIISRLPPVALRRRPFPRRECSPRQRPSAPRRTGRKATVPGP